MQIAKMIGTPNRPLSRDLRPGPLNIGGKAWWKFPKIWLLCTDEISKISPKMFGLQQAWAPKVKICSDCPSGLKKPKFVRTASGPENSLFLFGLAIRPQKRFALPPNDNQIASCTEIKSLWHPYRPYYSPRPEYLKISISHSNKCKRQW